MPDRIRIGATNLFLLLGGIAAMSAEKNIPPGYMRITSPPGECRPQTWRTQDDIIDGWDWSLPPGTEPDPTSGVSIAEWKVGAEFPGRLSKHVSWSWRKLEPEEGKYDFESLEQAVLDASQGGSYAVELHLRASVWELRHFPEETDYPRFWDRHRERSATAPRWLEKYDIPLVEMKKHGLDNIGTPFQVVNMDIWHPEYHKRYLRMVRALGESGIPRMPEATYVFVHLWSSSRGEEGAGPPEDDPGRELFRERLEAWSEACRGCERKLVLVSHRERDLKLGYELGMGQRNGFVEMYMLHCQNKMLGQSIDPEGYLVVDETCPLIAENRASGDENEEYNPPTHLSRFGPYETWPHRYRESMLRALQMRRNFLWTEGGPRLMNPKLLSYVALELGKTAKTAPDAWCYLRESPIGWSKNVKQVRNFERWLFQRDRPGAETHPCAKVKVQKQRGRSPDLQYDYTARRTDIATGNDTIGFNVSGLFLSGGPHEIALKITYHDIGTGSWILRYRLEKGNSERTVTCGDTCSIRTATFFLDNARFSKNETGFDFEITARDKDAMISFVRVIKL